MWLLQFLQFFDCQFFQALFWLFLLVSFFRYWFLFLIKFCSCFAGLFVVLAFIIHAYQLFIMYLIYWLFLLCIFSLSPRLSPLSLLVLAPFNYIYFEVRKFAFHCLHSCCTFRCSCNCCLLLLLLLQFMHILPTNSVVALLWFLRLCATKLFVEGRHELKTNLKVWRKHLEICGDN